MAELEAEPKCGGLKENAENRNRLTDLENKLSYLGVGWGGGKKPKAHLIPPHTTHSQTVFLQSGARILLHWFLLLQNSYLVPQTLHLVD